MKLEYDVKKLFMDAFAPQPNETVTFLNDFPSDRNKASEAQIDRWKMTLAWHSAMMDLADLIGFNVAPVIRMELRDPAPGSFDADGFTDDEPIDFTSLMERWGPKDIVIAVTGPSITGMLLKRLQEQNFRFASAPGVRSDFEGFKADYSKIPLRFELLVQKMAKASAADMVFRLDKQVWKCSFDLRGQRYQYLENGAARRPGEFINLPSGCANIQPYPGLEDDPRGISRTEGEIPALIDGELVIYQIRENRIVNISGSGPAAEQERRHVLESSDPTQALVTKLGLGVNEEARCNGTHVGDEKTMGMHWGYGPKKHFPDTIWAEHPINMDMDFVYPDGSREAIFRNSLYSSTLGELF